MTKEERRERAQQRSRELREWNDRMLPAQLEWRAPHGAVTVQIGRGDLEMRVSKRGEWRRDSRFPTWESATIQFCDNPDELIGFIRALAARYNWMIEELNKKSEGCRLDKALSLSLAGVTQPGAKESA